MKVLLGLLLASFIGSNAYSNTWNKVKAKADFRYRSENTKDEFKSEGQTRQRIRARLGLGYEVDENTHIKIRLATAGTASSTNDTLGDESTGSSDSNGDSVTRNTGSANAVYFDQVYVSHKMNSLKLNIGRMAFPFYKAGSSQMIWDSDFNPEGIHGSYTWNNLYVNLASFWVDENKATSTNDGLDVTVTSSQVGYGNSYNRIKYNFGLSNYHYENANAVNTFSADEGMNILEAYLELQYAKIVLWYSATSNNEAQEYNKATILGIKYGKTKKKGDWKIGANSRTVELNALAKNFMDGDFAGQTTDSSGSIIFGKYMLTDKSYISFGYFQNKKNADEKADPTKDAENYTKLQLDYGLKF